MKNSIFRKKIAYLLAAAVVGGSISSIAPIELRASIVNEEEKLINDDIIELRTTSSTITIGTLKEIRNAAKEGAKVKAKGIVTKISGNNMYIQDDTAGIYLYGKRKGTANVGDEVVVEGKIKYYSKLLEIVEPEKNAGIQITKLSSGHVTTPQAITIQEYKNNSESYESELIEIKGVTIGATDEKNYTEISDENNTTEIYKMPKGIKEGYDKYNVLGVGGRYNNRYYLTVVNAEDIIPSDGMLDPEDITIKAGTLLELPKTIEVLKDGIATQEPITWVRSDVDAIDTSKAGIYEVRGEVAANGRTFKINVGIAASEVVTVADIQGKAHQSPFMGKVVAGVEGVVTIIDNEGFYMQSNTPDEDEATSEGIYVARRDAGVKAGQLVSVNGLVEEVVSPSTNPFMDEKIQLTTTQITANKIEVIKQDVELPVATIIGTSGRIVPNKIIDNDGFTVFDPQEDAIDFYESLEGMLVQLNNSIVVGAPKYDEIPVVPDRGAHSLNGVSPNGGVTISENTLHPEIITLTKGKETYQPDVVVGDVLKGSVEGILGYNDGNYKIFVSNGLYANKDEIERHTYNDNPQTTLEETEDGLRIASFNVENLAGNAANIRFTNIAKAIGENLKFPDIIGLQEVQDNNGENEEADGIVEANRVYERIIEALEKLAKEQGLGNIKYGYTEITPVDSTEGGAPGANIRVGMLYRTDRVQLAEGQKGDSTTATKVVKGQDGKVALTLNPGRVEPQNPSFEGTRRSLATEFIFKGEKIIVINNHLRSKREDDSLFGNKQPAQLHSEVDRIKQAEVINGFIKEIMAIDKNAKVVVLGDMNDFQFSNPVKALQGKELYNMINKIEETGRYTYNYQGRSQVLDNILVTKVLESATEVEIVHINSPKAKGVQISDHDPVMIRLNMNQIKEDDSNSGSTGGSGDDNDSSDSSTSGGSSSESKNETTVKPEAKPEVTPVQTSKVTIALLQNKTTKDGKAVKLTVTPFLEKGRVIAGIRDISVLLGIDSSDIIWDQKTKTVHIKGKNISVTVGKAYALVNGEKVDLGVAPKLVNDRVILPVAHIGRILGMEVEFNQETKEITILQ